MTAGWLILGVLVVILLGTGAAKALTAYWHSPVRTACDDCLDARRRLQAELATERAKHDEEAYNDMKAAKEMAETQRDSAYAVLKRIDIGDCCYGGSCVAGLATEFLKHG